MIVLLASPKGNVSGGIARWTTHILRFYESLDAKEDFKLLFFNTARKKQTPNNILGRLVRAIADYPSMLFSFKSFVNSNHIDVLHLTSSASLGLIKDFFMLKLAKRKRIKTVIHFRFGRAPELKEKQNWEWKLLNIVMNLSDHTIFLDKGSYDAVVSAGIKNVSILPNPISPYVNQIIDKVGELNRNEKLVLFVGHCTKKKGVLELVEAASKIPNVSIKFVGSIIDDLKTLIPSLINNNKNISFVGELPYEEIIREMLSCGIFVLPSYTEGFPNVILEAMACGCTIVATSVGAIPEMLENDEDGNYGILVKPQNVEDLRSAMEKALSDRLFREECQSNVMRRVNVRYSMLAVWSRMEDIWYQTINQKYV